MKQTSLIAFNRNPVKRLRIKDKILEVLDFACGGLTAYEVAEELQLPITSIRPRLTDLYNEKKVFENGTKWDHHCDQQCIVYKLRRL